MVQADDRSVTMAVAVAGTVLVTAYAVFAAVHILVLNPLLAAPGRDLAAIQRDLDAAGESLQPFATVAILGTGVALAIFVLVMLARRPDATPTTALVAYLVLLTFGTPAYFVASFGAGMALADTYAISGADHSPWAGPLYAVSGLAFLGVVVIVVAQMMRRQIAAHAERT